VSGTHILFRISNHEGSMKINGVLAGREFVQERGWLFALARFAKPMRTNVRAQHFSATTAKIHGEGIEPLEELVRRKVAFADPALDCHNGAQKPARESRATASAAPSINVSSLRLSCLRGNTNVPLRSRNTARCFVKSHAQCTKNLTTLLVEVYAERD